MRMAVMNSLIQPSFHRGFAVQNDCLEPESILIHAP
jgi:hypothetical protein